MVSHTWQLPNGQARPGTAPAVAHPSHAVTRWAELHTGPESQVCSVSPTRAHTHKHNSTLLRSLTNTPGTARHTQARSGTHRPSGSRLADTPAEPSHTGAHPGTVELYTSHLTRRTHSTHAPSHTKTDIPKCSNFRAKAARARHVPRSHTHRCTGTKFWCDRRAHTHGDTCTYTSAPEKLLEWHAGRVRTYREHTDTHRDPRTTPAHAHTTPRRPRLGTSFEGLGRLPPSVAGSSQFLHSLWPYLVHADPLRPLVPRWRGHAGLTKQGSSLHSRVQAPGRPSVCTPAGRAAARLGLPRTTTPRRRRAAPTQRLRHPPPPPPCRRHRNYNSQKALRRHAVERRLSLSKSPRRAGPANGGGTPRPQGGGRSPQSLKRLRIREAKLVTPGHTALWFACHSSPLSNGSHLSQTIAVVPPESRESEKLIDVGK